jgi:tetratricopeptide (TPR) repeat protein
MNIELIQSTIVEADDDDELMPWYLNVCGTELEDRFEAIGNMVDLDVAIEIQKSAYLYQSNSVDKLCGIGEVLCSGLILRFDMTNDISALDEAIEISEKLLEQISVKQKFRPGCRRESARAHFRRWRLRQNSYDTDLSTLVIRRYKEAINLLQMSRPQYSIYTNELGQVYEERFLRFGQIEYFQEAVGAYEDALKSLRTRFLDRQHPDEAIIQLGISNIKMVAFYRWDSESDLRAAIRLLESCVNSTPTDHAPYIGRLGSLAVALRAQATTLRDASRIPDLIQRMLYALHD